MQKKEKEYDEFGRVIRENRSALKRERQEIKLFVMELLKLPAKQYALLPLSPVTQAAFIEGKRLIGNAFQRHLNYLVRLISEHDIEQIRYAHQTVNHPYLHHDQKNQRILREIDRLLADDPDIFPELIALYADFDIQYVRQLCRAEQKYRQAQAMLPEEERGHTIGKHQRRLQQYLHHLVLKKSAE